MLLTTPSAAAHVAAQICPGCQHKDDLRTVTEYNRMTLREELRTKVLIMCPRECERIQKALEALYNRC